MEKKKDYEDLTIEKVKSFKGFENISDEEAANIAYSLKQFSLLTYRYYTRQKQKEAVQEPSNSDNRT
ncbi:MAG: hypothetical protein HY840_16070 [Bacteroidetes bacterium]|nr:hypothetical protein [Bacteroidota bacterium]